MNKFTYLLFCLFLLASCRTNVNRLKANKETDKIKIAFGSCSDQDIKQTLWDDILVENPDLWIWLGDNIYGDTEDMAVLRSKYQLQKSNKEYSKLRRLCPIIGTWDDHDYGANDVGREYPMKAESQQLFFDFLDVPDDHPNRKTEGVYSSYVLNHPVAKVKVLLLDARYFRDTIEKIDTIYTPNLTGTVLGSSQWNWLENELKNSDAAIHVIASGIQVIPEDHRFEKWANYPNERDRLFDLISNLNVKNPIFISGDRHIGEISKLEWKGKALYDITSSSLTRSWSKWRPENNQHRIGELVYKLNYGLLEIRKAPQLSIRASIKGEKASFITHPIPTQRLNE